MTAWNAIRSGRPPIGWKKAGWTACAPRRRRSRTRSGTGPERAADASFDLLFFAEGFFYSPDPGEAARELLRVARPGGHAVITLPLVWEYRRDRLEHRFTAPELATVFEGAGWADVETAEVGGYAVSWALLSGRIVRALEEYARARSRLAWRLRPLFAAAYFAISEVLTNAAKHARASAVRVASKA